MNREQIRAIFQAHGFTVKEGQTDLKPYVYEAAEALLRAALEQPAGMPAGYVLVPECPYDAQPMIAAFLQEDMRPGGSESNAYRALIAARPAVVAGATGAPTQQPLTAERIKRHTLRASECPAGTEVMLVSSVLKLLNIGEGAAPGGAGEPS